MPSPRAPGLAPVALLLALGAAAPSAQAQELCALAEPALNPAAQEHEPGETLRYALTVEATGIVGGEAQLAVEQVSPGWNATLPRPRFPLEPGQPETVEVLVQAPPEGGARQASVSIGVALECRTAAGAPAGTARDTAVLSPSLAAPAPPGAPAPEGSPALAGLALLVLAVAAAGGAALLLRRPGVALRAPEPRRDVAPGGGASFPLVLANRGGAPLRVEVRVGEPRLGAGAAQGWRVVAPPREASLGPREEKTLQVLLRSPGDAKPGDRAEVEVEAHAPSRRPARARLQAFVAAEGRGAEEERPEVLIRDEASQGRRRQR